MNFEESGINLRNLQNLHFTRKTLPAKIIQLRKISQENHVRRMRNAQHQKELQGSLDISPRRLSFSNNLNPPLALPPCSRITSQTSNVEKSKQIPLKTNGVFVVASSDDRQRRLSRESKCVFRGDPAKRNNERLKISKKCLLGKVGKSYPVSHLGIESKHHNSESAKKPSLATSQKDSSKIDKNDSTPISTFGQNQTTDAVDSRSYTKGSTGTKGDGLHPFERLKASNNNEGGINHFFEEKRRLLDNQETNNAVDPKTIFKSCSKRRDQPGSIIFKNMAKSTELKNGEKTGNKTSKEKSPLNKMSCTSKIPVSVCRIGVKDSNMKSHSGVTENSSKSEKQCESLPFSFKNIENDSRSDFFNQLSLSEDTELNTGKQNKASGEPNSDVQKCSSVEITDSYKNSNQHHEADLSPNKLSSITKWLEGIVIAEDSGVFSNSGWKVFSSAPHMPSPENKSLSASYENISAPTPVPHQNLQPTDMAKDSGISNKPSSGSSTSNETFESCGTEEVLDMSSELEKQDVWKEKNFEDDSTITVPSDKDLDLANFRHPNFRHLPDYPNTPYYLRYPRYKAKQVGNVYCSPEIGAGDETTQTKSMKNRKKLCNLTPKIKKSGKTKKCLKAKKLFPSIKDIFQ